MTGSETRIRINKGKELWVNPGRSLLATLREQHVFLSSGCGGRGACGMCRVKIKSGVDSAFSVSELHWLSGKERNEGFRLACQVAVAGELEIEVPEKAFSIRQYRAQVTSISDLTHDVKSIRLRLVDPPEMNFKAGQFVHFEVPAYDGIAGPVYRAYSIASNPVEKSEIELQVKYAGGGISTTYIHKYLKTGDGVTIIGPDGELCLRNTDRNIIFIAGGSGMAPIRSMLLDMLNTGNRRKAVFFLGVKAARDLVLADEMRELEKKLPDFRFVPALSEPTPGDNWQGEKGLVTEVVNRLVKSGQNTEAYLCGNPPMINACLKVLKSKGIPEEGIYYDRFV
jgi:Na+-transporting NADH:ubiquinone oxidoreductase subunit F